MCFDMAPFPLLLIIFLAIIVLTTMGSGGKRRPPATRNEPRPCPRCGTAHPLHANYCRRCGQRLP